MEEQARTQLFSNALDPLLERLSANYVDDSDLSNAVRDLFAVPWGMGWGGVGWGGGLRRPG